MTSLTNDFDEVEINGYNSREKQDIKFAGNIKRLFSFMIDCVIIRIAANIVNHPLNLKLNFNNVEFDIFAIDKNMELFSSLLFYVGIESLILFLISFIYFVLFWTFGGQTVGKKMLGLKVVGVKTIKVGFSIGFLRFTGYFISFVSGLGFFWILFDRKKQGWHDKLADTYVIEVC